MTVGRAATCGDDRVLFAVDSEGIFMLSDGPGLEALGLGEVGELVGRSVFDVYRGTEAVEKNVCRALSGEEFVEVVEVEGLVLECSYAPLRNGEGSVVGAVGVARNLRGGRAGVPSSCGGEDWFARFVESSPDLVTVAGPDGLVRYVTPAVEGLLGYTPEEFVGLAPDLPRLVEEIIHPEDWEIAVRELAEAASSPAGPRPPVVAVRVRHKDGSWRSFEGHVNNLVDDPAVGGLVFVSRDVTERVRAEEEIRRLNEGLETMVRERTKRLEAAIAVLEENERRLKESEERFRLAFEAAAVGMAHVAPDGRWIRVNDKLCEIVGYGREELLGLTFQDITHPDDLDADLEHVRALLRGELSTYSMEKRYIKRDLSRIWARLTVSIVRAHANAPDYFVSVVEDVTERKLEELVPDALTSRELNVLRLVSEGRTNGQIAGELRYSTGTIKHRVQTILVKLRAKTRKEAAERAVEIGLLPPPNRTGTAR